MAVVFLAINGVGLGHLARAISLCRVLETVGEHPVIFSQGVQALDDSERFPGKTVPSLWRAQGDTRARVASEIASIAEISEPAVLVEDTHPNPIGLPSGIRRVLVVRPTTLTYLSELNSRYGNIYAAFLLCDSPDSPTWPYAEEETRTILSWPKWHVIGPVYRTPSEADLADVKKRYAIGHDHRLCVFSMGGGGQSRPGDLDVERFVVLSSLVAQQLRCQDRASRFVFVKGPYFPADAKLDPSFEIVSHEPRMPALLAVARGAVIRAGFNTIWECLASGTPFLAFVGTTFAEPTVARLDRLRSRCLLTDDLFTFWSNEKWRDQFRLYCRELTQRWPGQPEVSQLRQLLVNRPQTLAIERKRAARYYRAGPDPQSNMIDGHATLADRRFVLRIDDVVTMGPELQWLLQLLASRQLRASLEVIPYLTELNETDLAHFDPSLSLFEVSQHGYAHIPNTGRDGNRYEFGDEALPSLARDFRDIRRGKLRLEIQFPSRFLGGFSPPFDALPNWLPNAWHQMGGKFVSTVYQKQTHATAIPVIRAGVELWNWRRRRGRHVTDIIRDIEQQWYRDGHSGIIIHTRCLRASLERGRLLHILTYVRSRGASTASLRELAESRRLRSAPAPRRQAYLGRLLAWITRRS